MAKLTALEVFNAVARNCGESTVAGLTALSGLQLVIWDKIIEAIQDICTDENTRVQFLEAEGSIPMTTGNYKYLISGLTSGSDMMTEDIKSLRSADNSNNLVYLTPQEFDEKYPGGITSSRQGYPTEYTKFGGYFVFNNQATATQNGKNISFRYWKLPAYYVAATPTGTSDIPEPFDRTLLVALASLKVLTYLGNDEASVYKVQVFGNNQDIEGSLDKMKRIYSSPILKPRVTYRF
jgi:hypothetical protein